jgi:hypothetical protein
MQCADLLHAAYPLQEVPACLQHLSALRALNLEYNSLAALPGWLTRLAALEQLELAGNQLQQLPPSIGSLRGLKQLQLGGWQFHGGMALALLMLAVEDAVLAAYAGCLCCLAAPGCMCLAECWASSSTC